MIKVFKRFIRSSVKRQFMLALITLIFVVQTLAMIVNLIDLRRSLETTLKDNTKTTLHMISELMESPLGEFNIPEVTRIAEEITDKNTIIYTRIFDSSGSTLVEFGSTNQSDLYVAEQEVLSSARGGEKIGSIEIGVSRLQVEKAYTAQLYYTLLAGFLLCLTIAFAVKVMFEKLVLAPLANLSKFASEEGNLERLEKNNSRDELGQLSRTLFNMSLKIQEHREQLEIQVAERTRDLQKSKEDLSLSLQELKTAQDTLVQNSSLAAIGRLSASIAHEINNPLTILRANAESLKIPQPGAIDQTEMFHKKLSKIKNMCLRISSIVNGMRAISRSNTDQPFTLVSVKELLADSIELSQLKFRGSNVKLICDPSPEIEFECKPIQISQVIINLLSNGFDAVAHNADAWVRLTATQIDQSIHFSVTDSGNGIPDEIAQKLMQPFFTTKGVGAGTGLGLSISLGIAKDHQGEFYLDKSSKNTCFVLSIPISQMPGKSKVA